MEAGSLQMPDIAPADDSWDSRTRRLLGDVAAERLAHAKVAVIGTGGVGGYAVETLARSGVGNLIVIDADNVAESNLNRQLIALKSTIGKSKVELFRQRCRDINPQIEVMAIKEFVTPDNAAELIGTQVDYVIDAIDTVAPKIAVITHCLINHIPIISSMGQDRPCQNRIFRHFGNTGRRSGTCSEATSEKKRHAACP